MLIHLFKLIWNKKRQNFLLLFEIFISFLVLFTVFTLVVYYGINYKRDRGFDPTNIWSVALPQNTVSHDSTLLFHQSLEHALKSLQNVEDVSFTSWNVPYSMGTHSVNVGYKGKGEVADYNPGAYTYDKLLGITMQSGRWYKKEDISLKEPPVVINVSLKEKLFGEESPIGKKLEIGNGKMNIVGVVNDFKGHGDYIGPGYNIYSPIDTGDFEAPHSLLIKVKPGANAPFERVVHHLISSYFTNANIEIGHLEESRASKNKLTLVPIIILLIISGFLIINVALGLFGVLWYTIHKRRSEIGLRRAIGATANAISSQLVSETMVLATLSVVLGLFFAVQFPLLNVFDLPARIYIMAIFLSAGFIYLLVVICSIYPGRQAAAIYPAIALHED